MSFLGRARGALALLVLVALLICHGFVGAPQHDAPDSRDHLPRSGEHPDVSLAHASYYAVSLILVLLGALLGGARTWSKLAAASFVERRFFAPPVPHLARGPTAPLVQVFRL